MFLRRGYISGRCVITDGFRTGLAQLLEAIYLASHCPWVAHRRFPLRASDVLRAGFGTGTLTQALEHLAYFLYLPWLLPALHGTLREFLVFKDPATDRTRPLSLAVGWGDRVLQRTRPT